MRAMTTMNWPSFRVLPRLGSIPTTEEELAHASEPRRTSCTAGDVPHAYRERRLEERHDRRHIQGQDRSRVLLAGRLHADLLLHARPEVQRARAGVLRQRRGPCGVYLSERCVRD